MRLSSVFRRGNFTFSTLKSSTKISMPTRALSSTNKPMVFVKESAISPTENPWKEVHDPKGSGLSYWWNPETNETTALGEPKPDHWLEVRDPDGSDLTYWWNPETNQTTSLGQSKPMSFEVNHRNPFQPNVQQPRSFGGHMMQMMGLGFGISLGMILIRSIIG
mmetsp:Transcript_5677/g.8608  ORF Transcript_5677/g.8608 Transcript_5677/m.8608 type:complete len:163 (+) Transcript_5677:78-566(+)